jgi:hypothetical protein
VAVIAVVRLAHLLRVPEVRGSNLKQETDSSEVLHGFLSPMREMMEWRIKLGHGLFFHILSIHYSLVMLSFDAVYSKLLTAIENIR